MHNSSTSLDKYGQSQNKLFEYLASGKSVIQTYTSSYSVLEKYQCGASAIKQIPDVVADVILELCRNEEEAKKMGNNARYVAYDLDFIKSTNDLINVIKKA